MANAGDDMMYWMQTLPKPRWSRFGHNLNLGDSNQHQNDWPVVAILRLLSDHL